MRFYGKVLTSKTQSAIIYASGTAKTLHSRKRLGSVCLYFCSRIPCAYLKGKEYELQGGPLCKIIYLLVEYMFLL